MKKTVIIFLFLKTLKMYGNDTTYINSSHFLFDRNYGINLGYLRSFNNLKIKNDFFGIGYFVTSKSNRKGEFQWANNHLFEIDYFTNFNEIQELRLNYIHTPKPHKKTIEFAFGLGLSLNNKLDVFYIPKIGLNSHLIDLMLNFDINYKNPIISNSYSLSLIIRPNILMTTFRPMQSFSGSQPLISQYKINKINKARRKGKILLID